LHLENKSAILKKDLKKYNMCKNCEVSGITMELRYLQIPETEEMADYLSQEVKAFKMLFESGWYEEDLIQRAYAHLKWMEIEAEKTNRPHFLRNAKAFLSSMAKGFKDPFKPEDFLSPEDPLFEMKEKVLRGIKETSDFFGNRVPSVVWNSFAYLATRENPEESRSILKEADALPHHYGIVDTVLHGTAKCYKGLFFLISNVAKESGFIIDHNCDCSCSLVNLLPQKGEMVFKIKKEQAYEVTQSMLTHILAESHLILNCKLPFEYTVTKEAGLLPGITVAE
jgi:hypothetical protein